ncbi:MAG TPA: hypothetical protein VIJ94_10315 [Caulobacteraceae bacterium]
MGLNLQQIESALETGLKYVQEIAPLAALGGPAAAAIGATVAQVAGMATEVLTAVENDAAIIASGDLTKIRALEASLQAENKQLAAQIAAS